MSVLNELQSSLKEILLSFTPNRSLYEAMMKYDFKIESRRQNLMQLCFSALANWPLLLILIFLGFDPFGFFWILQAIVQKIFGSESSFRFFLLDGQLSTMLLVGGCFFFAEWILRKEYLLISVIFLFLSQGQIHLNLALAGLLGIYFSRASYLWWFHVELVSETRSIWKWVTSLQLISCLAGGILSLMALDFYQKQQVLVSPFLRFQFLFLALMGLQLANFLFLSVFGHFYLKIKKDPSFLPIYFSTTTWILRFKMSFHLKRKLKEKVSESLQSHQHSRTQILEIKDQSLGLRMGPIEKIIKQELAYLQTAASRLTID